MESNFISSDYYCLTIIGVTWALIAHFNRKKYREPQEGLSKAQHTTILFLPLFLATLGVLFIAYAPGITPLLPIYALGIMFFLSTPFLRTSAEWIGVPLKIRQAATQIAGDVVIGFVFLILVSGIADILDP